MTKFADSGCFFECLIARMMAFDGVVIDMDDGKMVLLDCAILFRYDYANSECILGP